MDLIHLHRKVILYPLNGEVLPHALELVTDVGVVRLGAPFLLEEFEGFLEDGERAYGLGVGGRGETEVGLFEFGGKANNRVAVPVDDVLIEGGGSEGQRTA